MFEERVGREREGYIGACGVEVDRAGRGPLKWGAVEKEVTLCLTLKRPLNAANECKHEM